jgi:disulfide bond formation protein DsbB
MYHVGVENEIFKGLKSCSVDISNTSREKLLEIISSPYTAKCNEIPWEFLTISMAGWNSIISLFLLFLFIFNFRLTGHIVNRKCIKRDFKNEK